MQGFEVLYLNFGYHISDSSIRTRLLCSDSENVLNLVIATPFQPLEVETWNFYYIFKFT